MRVAYIFCFLTLASCSAPTPDPSKIEGAFGFKLGEKIAPDQPVAMNLDGSGVSEVLVTNGFPPFDMIRVSALLDRTIFEIYATHTNSEWSQKVPAVIAALDRKYGPHRIYLSELTWDDTNREIKLADGILFYTDLKLLLRFEDNCRDIRAKKKRPAFNL